MLRGALGQQSPQASRALPCWQATGCGRRRMRRAVLACSLSNDMSAHIVLHSLRVLLDCAGVRCAFATCQEQPRAVHHHPALHLHAHCAACTQLFSDMPRSKGESRNVPLARGISALSKSKMFTVSHKQHHAKKGGAAKDTAKAAAPASKYVPCASMSVYMANGGHCTLGIPSLGVAARPSV